jgi:hypothetical protein
MVPLLTAQGARQSIGKAEGYRGAHTLDHTQANLQSGKVLRKIEIVIRERLPQTTLISYHPLAAPTQLTLSLGNPLTASLRSI